jgi:hypothetical protein
MGVVKLSTAGILDYSKTSNFLSGNAPLSLGSFDLLETTTLTTEAATISFTGLGAYSDYKHLQIRASGRGTTRESPRFTLNADSGSNYARHSLLGSGSTVASNSASSQAFININNVFTDADSDPDPIFGGLVIDILDFSSTNKNTTIRALGGSLDLDATYINLTSGVYLSTAAITSIETFLFDGNYSIGSRFSLYGIKGA